MQDAKKYTVCDGIFSQQGSESVSSGRFWTLFYPLKWLLCSETICRELFGFLVKPCQQVNTVKLTEQATLGQLHLRSSFSFYWWHFVYDMSDTTMLYNHWLHASRGWADIQAHSEQSVAWHHQFDNNRENHKYKAHFTPSIIHLCDLFICLFLFQNRTVFLHL